MLSLFIDVTGAPEQSNTELNFISEAKIPMILSRHQLGDSRFDCCWIRNQN